MIYNLDIKYKNYFINVQIADILFLYNLLIVFFYTDLPFDTFFFLTKVLKTNLLTICIKLSLQHKDPQKDRMI